MIIDYGKTVNHSGDPKSDHSKSSYQSGNTGNKDFLEIRFQMVWLLKSPDHLKMGPVKIQTCVQISIIFPKMAPICLDYRSLLR